MTKKNLRRLCLVLIIVFNLSCIAALLSPDPAPKAFSRKAAPARQGVRQLNTFGRLTSYNNDKTTTTNIGREAVGITWFHPAAIYLAGSMPFTAADIQGPADSINVTDVQFHTITLDKR